MRSGYYKEEYQNNMVSQISGKISHIRKWPKPGVLSSARECRVRGYHKPMPINTQNNVSFLQECVKAEFWTEIHVLAHVCMGLTLNLITDECEAVGCITINYQYGKS